MKFNESKYNSHWPDKELGELGEFRRGKSKHRPRNDKVLFEDGSYPLVQTGDIKAAELYVTENTDNYNEIGLAQSKLWPKDTLCITIAANIAETALLGYPMCFPDSVVGFISYPSESSELFMHYVFTYIRRAIQNSASGSIQDNINIDYLTKLEFKIPEKGYQDRVVSMLSCLDKKIELNNRINAELEAMAKTLYDYWFVQFDFPISKEQAKAMGKPKLEGKPYKSSGGKMVYNETLKREIPEGWESGLVSDLLIFNPEISISTGRASNYVDMNALPTKGYMTSKVQEKVFAGGMKFENGDVIVARITPCLENGKTALVTLLEENEPGFGSTEFIVLRGKSRPLSCFAAYLARSEEFRKYAITNMTGTSGRKRIDAKVLSTFSMPLPTDDLLRKFEDLVSPFFEKETNNTKQIQKLIELRDWLLPMLMNGQVSVG